MGSLVEIMADDPLDQPGYEGFEQIQIPDECSSITQMQKEAAQKAPHESGSSLCRASPRESSGRPVSYDDGDSATVFGLRSRESQPNSPESAASNLLNSARVPRSRSAGVSRSSK